MVSVRRRVSIIKIAVEDFQDMLTNLQPNKSNEYFQKLITGDPSHPAHQFFDPLPSGQHPSSIRSHTPPPTPHPDHPPTNQSHGLGNPHHSGRSHTDSVCFHLFFQIVYFCTVVVEHPQFRCTCSATIKGYFV